MFEYKELSNNYWITHDKIKGSFWPFEWIFIKNKYLWIEIETDLLATKYMNYKYSIWIYKNTIFVLSATGIERVIEICNTKRKEIKD